MPPSSSMNGHTSVQFWFEGVAAPIFAVNLLGQVIAWNRKMSDITGLAALDVCQRPLSDFVVSESCSFQDALKSLLQDKDENSTTCNVQLQSTKGNNITLLRVQVTANYSVEHDLVGAICFATEIDRPAKAVTSSSNSILCMATNAELCDEIRFASADHISVPFFVLDAEGSVRQWNTNMCELTGYNFREVCASESLFANDNAFFYCAELKHTIRKCLERKCHDNEIIAVKFPRKDGQILRLKMCCNLLLSDESQVAVIVQDETESYHVREEFRELNEIIEVASIPYFAVDTNGRITVWNKGIAALSGYDEEVMLGKNLVNDFGPTSLHTSFQTVQDVLDDALEGRGASNCELEFRTKSNDIKYLLVTATTRRDAETNVVGVVCVAQDVTEAIQRDLAVAGMAAELRQVIDTAKAPIFGIDTNGNVNEWNRRAHEITGYSKEETFDMPLVQSFIAPHMQQKVQEVLDAALQGRETSDYELEFVSKSGEPVFMLVNATTRRDPDLNVVGVVGVGQDVTEDRRKAEELRKLHCLQATQEAKVETERNMTAYFAHELRNPLNAIDNALIALPEDLPGDAKEIVAGMRLCSSFMSSIMNNLLDVRKMEEGKMTLHKMPISLKAVLSGVYSMLKSSVKPGVEFKMLCNTDARDWVMGDQHRIQQVYVNVTTNAIKYTVTGSIVLSIGWENDMVKFECNDTGPGIPKTEQTKLFHRFVQRGGAPGTGLGLAIAKHLVDLANGSIVFESDPSLKAGTTCRVLIPLALCQSPETSNQEDDSDEFIDAPLRWLIVDDIKMNRVMLRRRIEAKICPNCIITEVATGEAALEICGEQTFDVIVVDQYMEEAGGVLVGTDVVYAMRRMRINAIIIGCSGNDLEDEFREAGADWVWQKPMPSNKEIISRLRSGLAERHLI